MREMYELSGKLQIRRTVERRLLNSVGENAGKSDSIFRALDGITAEDAANPAITEKIGE
jgi:hypothetical protein